MDLDDDDFIVLAPSLQLLTSLTSLRANNELCDECAQEVANVLAATSNLVELDIWRTNWLVRALPLLSINFHTNILSDFEGEVITVLQGCVALESVMLDAAELRAEDIRRLGIAIGGLKRLQHLSFTFNNQYDLLNPSLFCMRCIAHQHSRSAAPSLFCLIVVGFVLADAQLCKCNKVQERQPGFFPCTESTFWVALNGENAVRCCLATHEEGHTMWHGRRNNLHQPCNG